MPAYTTSPAYNTSKDAMSRIFLFVALVLVVVLCVGGVLLGAFPPDPKVQQIQKVIPNDRFKPPS